MRSLALLVIAAVGCVGPPEDATAEREASEQEDSELRSCDSRWQPSAQAAEAGNRASVSYSGAGGSCSGGPTSGAVELGRHVKRQFSELVNDRVAGDGVQIYNCRRIRGGRGLSLHATGRALDIFVPTVGGRANNAAGDVIANWLVTNAEHIGVQSVIWDRARYRASGSDRFRCYTGSNPHADHIHVELSQAAAARRTPFFQGVPAAEPEPEPVAEPVPADEPVPAVEAQPARQWIGGVCDSGADCESGSCFERICVQGCAGYCPDRAGQPTTFCAPREALGAAGDGGLCVSKAHELNRRCAHRNDVLPLEVERHVGASRARHGYATVCAPSRSLPAAAPEPQPMCGGRGVAVSNNGDDCAGTPEDTWRCACSGQWDIPISQVCRDGRWLTFHTDPKDCGGCAGRYSRACQ